jgi:hypothetical protein
MADLYQGLHKLDDLIFFLNKPLIGKKGLHYQKLLKDWSSIVGADIARYAIPTKISTTRRKEIAENILYIATNNAASAAELVYHLGILKEQINFYFGYEYIHQIKIAQAVFEVAEKKEAQVTKKLSQPQQAKLELLLNEYDQDDAIKIILTDIATFLLQK